ncbi:MAG: c-type cytochrome [Verrucomicrobiales bacterium]|nr:c-type cytochrome [Verrucomicrobiales bacterium]
MKHLIPASIFRPKAKIILTLSLAITTLAHASGPDSSKAKDNSVAAEKASLRIHPDFEISLFADEKLGISNPIALQWDHRGRAWVLCTLAYAQLKPGQIPNDKIFILEDTDGDNVADKSTIFADNLNMPTGFALGHGGVYLAEGADLVHLADTNQDDKADQKKIILSGFGTGDTHQNISNFVWDNGGFLYFSQGLHTDSQVETPWGTVRGVQAGFWRFDPRSTRLAPFCFPVLMSANPCGIALDKWGALFVKSNAPDTVFSTPGLIPTTHPLRLNTVASIGNTPGKSMGGEIIENAHLPKWLQDNIVIAGYFSRRVTALPLTPEDSGFAKVKSTELIYGEHVSFRPVDVQAGPDGALYIVDWFNPIINHYQVSLRHPDRDYEHGRIWRLTAKDKKLTQAPKLDGLSAEELFPYFKSSDRWTRDQVERLLMDMPRDKVAAPLSQWSQSLDPKKDAHALLEAAGVLEAHNAITPALLEQLVASPEPLTRAVAARIISRSHPLPDNAMATLAQLARDPHPRPRLETVIACSSIATAESFKTALTVLDSKMDRFIDYSLTQTVHALKEQWLPALESGKLTFDNAQHLAYTLESYGGAAAASLARKSLESGSDPATQTRLYTVLAKVGNAKDVQNILNLKPAQADLLNALITDRPPHLKPQAPFAPRLIELLSSSKLKVQIAAIRLAGIWKVSESADSIEKLALDHQGKDIVRFPALISLGQLKGKAAIASLQKIVADKNSSLSMQQAAITALVSLDIQLAAKAAADILAKTTDSKNASSILTPFLGKSSGTEVLAIALEKVSLQKEPAQKIASALSSIGRVDLKLSSVLNQAQGLQNASPEYDAEFVQRLAAEVRASGDAEKGKAVFNLPQTTCIACHKIGEVGGILGPDLTTVGAGLPTDIIIDSVIWPKRQIKEGYVSVSVTTKDQKIYAGYQDRIENGTLYLRDTATQKTIPIKLSDIAKKDEIGTIMPAGLTNSLTREQIRNLIAYLAHLKGGAPQLK